MPKASEPQLDLDDFLPYLIARIVPLIDIAVKPYLAPFEVTRESFRVIMVLHRSGPLSLNALAQATSMHFSTLSRLVGRMERRKLVRRKRVKGLREVEIELLPIGRQKCEALIEPSLKFERRLTGQFTEAHLASFKGMLNKIYDNYCAQILADGSNPHPIIRTATAPKSTTRKRRT
jgi:DNA-binding MarR family transcriptional regulator